MEPLQMATLESRLSLHGTEAWSALPDAPQVPHVQHIVSTHSARAATARLLVGLAHRIEPRPAPTRVRAPAC